MNFAKTSLVLHPILGENVTDIILGYMTIYDNTNNELKYDVLPDRRNVHKFCDQYLNNYKRHNFATNTVFEELKNIYDNFDDCGKSIIEQRLCKDHYHRCALHEELSAKKIILRQSMFSKWMLNNDGVWKNIVTNIKISELDVKLYNAFLEDMNVMRQEEIVRRESLEFRTDDENRSFC